MSDPRLGGAEPSAAAGGDRPGPGLDNAGLVAQAATEARKTALTAQWILREFNAYYVESRAIPALAKQAFEDRDPGRSFALSRRRLSIYSESVRTLGPRVVAAFPGLGQSEALWGAVEDAYLPLIAGRYEADLAFAYIHSVRRTIYQDEWRPVAYAFGETAGASAGPVPEVTRRFPGGTRLAPETAAAILALPGFERPYRDLAEDAFLVAERVNEDLALDGARPGAVAAIEMIDAGFYRNRGAYLVGRIELDEMDARPFVIALLNDGDGIYVDAVLTSEADSHNIFSSTLANFHVTDSHYHELSAFLHAVMPSRPLGLHYSTVGFNHVGKVAVMEELQRELSAHGEVFETAVGSPGTVAIGFSAPTSAYTLKVIRDRPTAGYKWGDFGGVGAVLDKYRRVHEINRTGSMLDNIIYANLRLDRDWFDPAVLAELLDQAAGSVSLVDGAVVLRHLIVQPKMIPIPVFLETASPAAAETAVVNLGHCLKNNAAANIFNKDLDGRNYGVSRFLKVYLFDYDALEPFTEVKIRTNLDRFDGEEDVPDWFFEDGVIFLPEELQLGLRISDRGLVRQFREVHGELLAPDYWEAVQRDLRGGKVPAITVYPEERRLVRQVDRLGTYF